jgi:hypothetical protein
MLLVVFKFSLAIAIGSENLCNLWQKKEVSERLVIK